MDALTSFERWYGRDQPPPQVVRLRAGALDLEFEQGDLRYIICAGREVVRRVYAAVRDVNWNTLPATITNLTINAEAERFHIAFDASHQDSALAFKWHGTIEGRPDGVIEYTLDGEAQHEFRYCRIGFCVLHPVKGIAGSPYHAITPQGPVEGVLPTLIEPQRMENGIELPIFPACSSLTVEHADGIAVITEFEGDLFEMEDQRNWTDGSFKTYCTPLALGYPHKAAAGQKFHQKVAIRASAAPAVAPAAAAQDAHTIRFTLDGRSDHRLPKIGFGMASHGKALDAREVALLSRLRPDHLKAELRFRDKNWLAQLEQAARTAKQLNCPLELAIFLPDDAAAALAALRAQLRDVAVVRLIVFHEAEAATGATSARWLSLAREHLSGVLPGTQFVGGTNGNFAELNRQQPDSATMAAMDGVAYTINPQVHATDERSLVEAIEAQRDTVLTARSFSGPLPISVSSVTLKPPFNQAATEEEAPPDPDRLPAAVDPRQMSLFAAAWTVASLKSLAEGGADSITYYETTGWRGLIETADGSPLPGQFRSFAGMVFPVYWVFAFLAGARQAALWRATPDRPLLLDGLVVQMDDRLRLLLANLQPVAQAVYVQGLPMAQGEASIRRLTAASMAATADEADAFWNTAGSLPIRDSAAWHTLEPYEVAFVELELRR